MEDCINLGVMIFLVLLMPFVDGVDVVTVNSGHGNFCNTSTPANVRCKTLQQAIPFFLEKSDIRVHLDSDVELIQLLYFERVHTVIIQGHSKSAPTKVNCRGKGGIIVNSCSNFSLSYLQFINCESHDNETNFDSAILFKSSSNISIVNSFISSSNYSGLILYNCQGRVFLEKTTFENNGWHEVCQPKSGGLTIETKRKTEGSSEYAIKNCKFYNNSVVGNSCSTQEDRGVLWGHYPIGGGISIILANESGNNTINISGTSFTGNVADWGGGLYIQFQNTTNNNRINVTHSVFNFNRAKYFGGGASLNSAGTKAAENYMSFHNVTFKNNHAVNGGGVGIQLSKNAHSFDSHRKLLFENCTWRQNTATLLSPAVDIAIYKRVKKTGYLTAIPFFKDVDIIDNHIETQEMVYPKNDTKQLSTGVFVVTETSVVFSGKVNFIHNYYSAIQAVSGFISFLNGTEAKFHDNRGINGGAIAMYGFSNLFLHQNVSLNFTGNTASSRGGAIFYNGIDQHDFFSGTNCFIEVKQKPLKNISLYFHNNKAQRGSSMYADSFRSCHKYCAGNKTATIHNTISCLGNFKFEDKNGSNLVTTSGASFNVNGGSFYQAIPGDQLRINITVADEFHQIIKPLLKIFLPDSSKPHAIHIKENYTLTPHIHPLGPPGASACIQVSVIAVRNIFYVFNLTLLPCPPGYVYCAKRKKCICGKGNYTAVAHCTADNFQAIVDQKYWVGYIPKDNNYTYKDLYFAPCYPPICSRTENRMLPKDPGELEHFICGKNTNRFGIMCGTCSVNYSVYYHSSMYTCNKNTNCRVGPILYACSELIPVIFLFLVIVMCDLSFTSGKVVGLIFLLQFLADANIPLVSPNVTGLATLVYGIFNLKLLTLEHLSFCLWESLDIQDIIAFKYVTILFAFTLVVIQIVLLKFNRCTCLCTIRYKVSRKNSFIRGLSAFLVICYIQCTNTSFQVLQFIVPKGINGKHAGRYTYYGGQKYFQGKHFYYSLIAILCLVVVTLLPLFLLLFHPFLLNILSFCHLSEHWITQKVYKGLRIQKLMPFIDCFQGCYKDQYRFFAGLYFVYRVALILCILITKTFNESLVYTQLLLVLFLVIHAIVYPYKRKLHNTLDSAAFSIMAVINLVTLISNSSSRTKMAYKHVLVSVQVFLLYLPMVACVLWVARRIYVRAQVSKRLAASLDEEITERQEEKHLLDCNNNSELRQHAFLRNYSY